MKRFSITFFILLLLISGQGAIATPKVLEIAAGNYHTCALLEDHSLYCWGLNNAGQTGHGDSLQRQKPTQVNLPRNKKAVHVQARETQTCVIYDDGSLSCWGYNGSGQLGLGTNSTYVGNGFNQTPDLLPPIDLGKNRRVIKLAMGNLHSCAILDNASLKCWGHNDYGSLGLGDIKIRGKNREEMGDSLPSIELGEAKPVQVGVGVSHTCALLSTGEVKCWGNYAYIASGSNSHLGISPTQMGNNLKPIQFGTNSKAIRIGVGQQHSCAVFSNGEVKCWGYSAYGSLGVGAPNFTYIGDSTNEIGGNLKTVQLGGVSVVDLSCGSYLCCAKFEINALKCWGYNGAGTLGLGDQKNRGELLSDMGENLPFVDLGRLFQVTHLAMGTVHACAVGANGEAKCWGYNGTYQLGNGSNTNVGIDSNQMGDKLLTLNFPIQESEERRTE